MNEELYQIVEEECPRCHDKLIEYIAKGTVDGKLWCNNKTCLKLYFEKGASLYG